MGIYDVMKCPIADLINDALEKKLLAAVDNDEVDKVKMINHKRLRFICEATKGNHQELQVMLKDHAADFTVDTLKQAYYAANTKQNETADYIADVLTDIKQCWQEKRSKVGDRHHRLSSLG